MKKVVIFLLAFLFFQTSIAKDEIKLSEGNDFLHSNFPGIIMGHAYYNFFHHWQNKEKEGAVIDFILLFNGGSINVTPNCEVCKIDSLGVNFGLDDKIKYASVFLQKERKMRFLNEMKKLSGCSERVVMSKGQHFYRFKDFTVVVFNDGTNRISLMAR
jgi:hypothetical protein